MGSEISGLKYKRGFTRYRELHNFSRMINASEFHEYCDKGYHFLPSRFEKFCWELLHVTAKEVLYPGPVLGGGVGLRGSNPPPS